MFKTIKLLTTLFIFSTILFSCEKDDVYDKNVTVFKAEMIGLNAVPSNTSKAEGLAILTFDNITKTFAANITYNGLLPNAGHIHMAQKEENGNAIIPFRKIVYIPTSLDGNQLEKEGDKLLRNESKGVSSTQQMLSNPFDKLDPSSPVTFQSDTSTDSKGNLSEQGLGNTSKKESVEVYSSQQISMSIPFEKGNLISPVTLRSNELTEEQIEALFEGRLYIDFHTNAYPNGEIRGQLKKQ